MTRPDSQEPINIHSLDRYSSRELALAARSALLQEVDYPVVQPQISRVLQKRSVGDLLCSILGRELKPADIVFAKGAVLSAVMDIGAFRAVDAVSPESREAVTDFLDRLNQGVIKRTRSR